MLLIERDSRERERERDESDAPRYRKKGKNLESSKVEVRNQFLHIRCGLRMIGKRRRVLCALFISDKIQPIYLPSSKETKISADTTAYVVGWGRDGYGFTGIKKLKYALMPLISKRKCTAYWRVDHRNICTAPGLGKNACQV